MVSVEKLTDEKLFLEISNFSLVFWKGLSLVFDWRDLKWKLKQYSNFLCKSSDWENISSQVTGQIRLSLQNCRIVWSKEIFSRGSWWIFLIFGTKINIQKRRKLDYFFSLPWSHMLKFVQKWRRRLYGTGCP